MKNDMINFFCLRKDCQKKVVKHNNFFLVNETTGNEYKLTGAQDLILNQMTHNIENVDSFIQEKIWSIEPEELLRDQLVELLAQLSPEYIILGSSYEDVESKYIL